MPSGEQIQAALTAFVAKLRGYTGSEVSEAQAFLNDLFACYGGDRRELGARFEHFTPAVLRDGVVVRADVARAERQLRA